MTSAGTADPLAPRILGFVRLARANGFRLGIRESLDALMLAAGPDLLSPHVMRAWLKSLLCSSAPDWQRFDDLFDAYWLRRGVRQAAAQGGTTEAVSGSGA